MAGEERDSDYKTVTVVISGYVFLIAELYFDGLALLVICTAFVSSFHTYELSLPALPTWPCSKREQLCKVKCYHLRTHSDGSSELNFSTFSLM